MHNFIKKNKTQVDLKLETKNFIEIKSQKIKFKVTKTKN